MYILSFFGHFFVANIFSFCQKESKFAIFFADSKSKVDASIVIFGHQTWDLEGGGVKLIPPSISWFSSTPAEIELTNVQVGKLSKFEALNHKLHTTTCCSEYLVCM